MAAAAIGKINSIEGSVEVVHADGSTGTLAPGATVYADDAITTGENSNIRIGFLDGTGVNIGPESTATLGKDIIDPALVREDHGSSQFVLDASGRGIAPDSGHDTEGIGGNIGTVETTEGVVEAVGEDGAVRVLKTGDELYASDVVRVGTDGTISIRMVDGSGLSFGPGTTARMSDSVSSSHARVADLTDPSEIQKSILAGRDPSLESTAPGIGDPGGNEGGVPVILPASSRAVTPDSGHDTHGFELPFRISEQDLLPPEEADSLPTIVVTFNQPRLGGDAGVVDEKGLPERSGKSAGTGEIADGNGTDNDDTSEMTSGGFMIDAGTDLLGKLEIKDKDGTWIDVTAGGTVPGENGVLEITNSGGVFTWVYTLTDNLATHPDNSTADGDSDRGPADQLPGEAFPVRVMDNDGDVSPEALLKIVVNDDGPLAVDDGPEAVTEDTTSFVSGDVLTNDVPGADTPPVFAGWTATGADNTGAITALNSYGTLVLNGDGSWSYTLDNALAATQALAAGESLPQELWYTLADADGDTSQARLTITVNGTDDDASVETAQSLGADSTVYEAGLSPDGSNAGSGSATATGTFTVSATDGILSIAIGGTAFTLAQVQAFNGSDTLNTGEGLLTLTGYSGDAFSGTVNYSYTLSAAIDNDSLVPGGADAVTLAYFDDSIAITVNGVGGTVASDDLVVRALDDGPGVDDYYAGEVDEGSGPQDLGVAADVLGIVAGADQPGTIEIASNDQNSGGTLAIVGGQLIYTPPENVDNTGDVVTESYTVTVTDSDGDIDTSIVTVDITGPALIVGSNADDEGGDDGVDLHLINDTLAISGDINGVGGANILVGDVGGTIASYMNANIILILDTSGSMYSKIEFTDQEGNTSSISRLAAEKLAVYALLDELAGSAANEVRVRIIEFNTDATSLGTFDLKSGDLQDAKDAVNALTRGGWTNYEAAIQEAIDWSAVPANLLDSAGGTINVVNQTFFISDGEPTAYTRTDGTIATNVRVLVAMSQVTGTDTTGHEQDNTDEVQILEDQFGPIEAVGIVLGSAEAIDNLNEMENEPRSSSPDVANNITTANELIGVLQDLNPLTALASAGNDTINGGAGNDFIFGDSVFTDTLAVAEGLTADEGSGWQVFTDLEAGMGMVTAGWDRDDTINYIRNNHPEIGAESEKGGVGRTGGNDIIDAGAGNDIVYGQEGDDIIEGGSGDDYLVGGNGADTFVWRAAESGTDVVNDFSTAEGDILNIADLLVGEEALDHSTDALLAAGLDGDYISISIDANATITLFSDGTGSGTPANDQIIEIGFDTTGFTDSAAVIESLLGSSNLVVD